MDLIVATSSYPLNPDDSAAAAGLFVRDFAAELCEQGHTVRVLTQQRAGPIADDPRFEVLRYPWRGDRPLSTLRLQHPADAVAMASVLRAGARALSGALAARRADRVLALWALPAGLLARNAKRRFGVPYRVWTLGSDVWSYGRNPLTRPILRRVLRGAERVFADGLELAEETARIAGRPCAFLPSSRASLPADPRAPAELAPAEKNFVFIGRFHENKGVDLLVEAIGLLPPQRRSASCFHVFGGGPLEERVRARVRELALDDCVRLPGFADRERAGAYLAHCDALIVPSRIESIPLVLSDAAQSGCPVVATRVGDMGRLLEQYGIGIAVAPDAPAIRDGLLAIWDEPRASYRPGLERMAADFSVSASARAVLADAGPGAP